jgi:hypothetical protein
MKEKSLLNKVRELLGMEVALEQMLMADGVTKIEADAFEGGNEVFVVTEDEQKIAVPVGEYELEDGRILVIVEEGIISEIKEVKEEEEMPEAPAQEVPEEATTPEMSAPVAPKKTIESIVKETFFSEIENLKKENEALKAELAKLSKVDEVATEATELSEIPTPISFNPENEMPTNHVKIGSKAPKGIMSSVLDKMYK